jgi:hypothetical protein
MRQDFAQDFVNLPRRGLATHALAELRLNHAEGRFDPDPAEESPAHIPGI